MPSKQLISKLFVLLSTTAPMALLLVVLPPAPSFAAGKKAPPPPSPLSKLHERVERAFVRCDASLLRPVLSRRIKTFVASRALAPADGYYGADQLLLLLERLFEGRTTIRFQALAADPKPRQDGRATLPFRWISSGGDQSRREISLALILALEGAHWQIREIRDLK
jgi:hypothetical protein